MAFRRKAGARRGGFKPMSRGSFARRVQRRVTARVRAPLARSRRTYRGAAQPQLTRRVRSANPPRVKRTGKATSGKPSFTHSGSGVRIVHREYLKDLVGTTDFTVAFTEGVNPGNKDLFPWLAGIAQNFQRYSINKLELHYNSTSGSISTSQALGEVMFSYHDNVSHRKPVTKSDMLILSKSISCVASANCSFQVPASPQTRYIRGTDEVAFNTATHGTRDTYDDGIAYISTAGMPAANTVGEVWVSYDISLDGKTSPASLQFGQTGSVHMWQEYGAVTSSTSATTLPYCTTDAAINEAVLFRAAGANSSVPRKDGNLPVKIKTTAGKRQQIVLPGPGQYTIICALTCEGGSATTKALFRDSSAPFNFTFVPSSGAATAATKPKLVVGYTSGYEHAWSGPSDFHQVVAGGIHATSINATCTIDVPETAVSEFDRSLDMRFFRFLPGHVTAAGVNKLTVNLVVTHNANAIAAEGVKLDKNNEFELEMGVAATPNTY